MKIKLDKKTIRQLYGIITSLLVLAVGVCFIAACCSIYAEGENPFSRERVIEAISSIAVPIWILIVFLVGAIPLHFLCPAPKEKIVPYSMKPQQLASLLERLGERPTQNELLPMKKEQNFRRYMKLGVLGIGLIMLIYPLIYVFTPSNFSLEAINEDVAHAMISFLPSLILSFGAFVAYSYIAAASVERELTALKELVKGNPSLLRAKKQAAASFSWAVPLRIFFLALAVTFIVIGIFNGGMKDVLSKAIKLCTECVGLG